MDKTYKGQRVADLLKLVAELEHRLDIAPKELGVDWWLMQDEVAEGYTSLAIAKAKLTALLGDYK